MNLILTGDTVPTDATRPSFDKADLTALFGDCLSPMVKSDFVIGNLECALTDRSAPIHKIGPNLKGRPDDAKVLRACGYTHLGLSNNHVLDFGISGMRDTVQSLLAAGIVPFGFGENYEDSRRPLTIQQNDVTVSIVAVCEHEYSYALKNQMGAAPFDPFDTMDDISAAKAHSDRVVVMYHGGKEQCLVPSPRLRRACRAMVRAGADLVVTQHSHCIGCREEYMGGEIVYGQGNFLFVEHTDHPHWHSGLMLSIDLHKEGFHIAYIPVVTTDTGITLAAGDEKATILSGFHALSDRIADEDSAERLWEAFCHDPQQQHYRAFVSENFISTASIASVEQRFAHYLDCEAHLDVWHTLFKTWHADGTSGA